jgi:hypothetical protein
MYVCVSCVCHNEYFEKRERDFLMVLLERIYLSVCLSAAVRACVRAYVRASFVTTSQTRRYGLQ